MALCAVIFASVNGVSKVNANLLCVLSLAMALQESVV